MKVGKNFVNLQIYQEQEMISLYCRKTEWFLLYIMVIISNATEIGIYKQYMSNI